MISVIMNGITWGMILFMIAAGMTIILGTLRVLNFAQASFFILGPFVAVALMKYTPNFAGPWLAIILAVPIIAVFSLAMERLVWYIRDREIEYQLILTYSFALIIYDLTIILFGPAATFIPSPSFAKGVVTIFGAFLPKVGFFIIFSGVAIMIFLWYFLNKTTFGAVTRAVSFDEESAQILGINPSRVNMIVFFIGIAIAVVGGVLSAMWVPASPSKWAQFVTFAFVLVVIGGMGSLKGAFIGSLIVGIATSATTSYFPKFHILVIFLIMIVVLIIRPTGLYGREVL